MPQVKKKVLHVITSLNDGGAEGVLYRLCSTDIKYIHFVISLRNTGKYGSLLEQAGIEVHCLNMLPGRVTLGGLLRLWRLLRQSKPDIVQTWMYHADLIGGILARLSGIRNVCWGIRQTNLDPRKSKRSTILVVRICAQLSKWVPRHIACCAQKAAEVHGALGYDASKFVVIPNGYELSVLQPRPEDGLRLRQELNLPVTLPLIGMVARFDPQKDHAGLIAALERVAIAGVDFRCILVGTGMEESNADLQGRIVSAGLAERIRLLGPRDDIPAVMNALDIHVLSSSFGEAFPNVLAEAMACGTPCATTDVGDAAMIVGDTGWVVPPGQPEMLADAITCALREHRNEAAWSVRCAAARSRILKNFSIEKMVRAHGQLWRMCLES
ncbi:MAG: glycosyltransferase [Candidatus Competibacter sp.]|nr:glycosyltransferase [Candidatus Competibacter sp.]